MTEIRRSVLSVINSEGGTLHEPVRRATGAAGGDCGDGGSTTSRRGDGPSDSRDGGERIGKAGEGPSERPEVGGDRVEFPRTIEARPLFTPACRAMYTTEVGNIFRCTEHEHASGDHRNDEYHMAWSFYDDGPGCRPEHRRNAPCPGEALSETLSVIGPIVLWTEEFGISASAEAWNVLRKRLSERRSEAARPDADDILAACFRQLDAICTWLHGNGHATAASGLHHNRDRFLLPLAKAAVDADAITTPAGGPGEADTNLRTADGTPDDEEFLCTLHGRLKAGYSFNGAIDLVREHLTIVRKATLMLSTAKYEITYFKTRNGKYYTTDEVPWPTDAPDHSGYNPLSSFHRIKTMHAVCMNAPQGFPQFSPAQVELCASEARHCERRDNHRPSCWVKLGGKCDCKCAACVSLRTGEAQAGDVAIRTLEYEAGVREQELTDLRADLACERYDRQTYERLAREAQAKLEELRSEAASPHDEGHPHLIGGEFQSDKYPTCPRGKVPLSVKDPTAQDLLWTYAQRRRSVDAEFATDLEKALRAKGYEPRSAEALPKCDQCNSLGYVLLGYNNNTGQQYRCDHWGRPCPVLQRRERDQTIPDSPDSGVDPAALCAKCAEPAHAEFMASFDAAPDLWAMPCPKGGDHEWRREGALHKVTEPTWATDNVTPSSDVAPVSVAPAPKRSDDPGRAYRRAMGISHADDDHDEMIAAATPKGSADV